MNKNLALLLKPLKTLTHNISDWCIDVLVSHKINLYLFYVQVIFFTGPKKRQLNTSFTMNEMESKLQQMN